MECSKGRGEEMGGREVIVQAIREAIQKHKNIVVSGEVGVGKIVNTLKALQGSDNVCYIGNPVDYVGKPRPKGYDNYINYIISLKNDMQVLTTEQDILSQDFSKTGKSGLVLVIDEIYGRTSQQYEKIRSFLDRKDLRVVLIAGCMKNIGVIIQHFNAVLMLTIDGVLMPDKDFVNKMCLMLRPDPQEHRSSH